MPAHVCRGTAASMLRTPLEGSPFALFVKLLVISAVHHTALQCLIPFRFVITDGESYMMEEFKIGHKVHSIYCLQSGLINFEVRKQKLKGSCQWPQYMEGWMLFNSDQSSNGDSRWQKNKSLLGIEARTRSIIWQSVSVSPQAQNSGLWFL